MEPTTLSHMQEIRQFLIQSRIEANSTEENGGIISDPVPLDASMDNTALESQMNRINDLMRLQEPNFEQKESKSSENKIEGIDLSKFFSSLDEKLSKIDTVDRNSFYVVGNTGVGKSTFVNYMLGTLYERALNGTLKPKNESIEKAPTSEERYSHTKYTQTYGTSPHAFTDSPGLQDTRKGEEISTTLANYELFNSKLPFQSLFFLIDASEINDRKLINFRENCKRLSEFINNPLNLEKSIYFVITKRQNVPNNDDLSSKEAFWNWVLYTLKDIETKYNEENVGREFLDDQEIYEILKLVTKENIIFADFTTDETRTEILKKIENFTPLQPDALQVGLKSTNQLKMKTFVESCFRQIIETLDEEKFIVNSLENTEEALKATAESKSQAEQRQKAVKSQSISTLSEKIKDNLMQINKQEEEIKKYKQLIEKKETQEKNLNSSLNHEQEGLNELNTNEIINFWHDRAEKKISLAVGSGLVLEAASLALAHANMKKVSLALAIAETAVFSSLFFPYKYSFEFKNARFSEPPLIATKLGKLNVIECDKKNGIFKAEFLGYFRSLSTCDVTIKGKKRYYHQKDIQMMKTKIERIQGEIDAVKKTLQDYKNIMLDCERSIKNYQESNISLKAHKAKSKENKNISEEIKAFLKEEQLNELENLEKVIADYDKQITELTKTQTELNTQKELLASKVDKQKDLYLVKNIEYLKRMGKLLSQSAKLGNYNKYVKTSEMFISEFIK